MKRIIVIMIMIAGAAGTASAAGDKLTQAIKLAEKRHYSETIELLRSDPLLSEPGKQGPAALTLGMAYFKSAALHRELHRAATLSALDYLKKLSSVQGKDRSRFADLYLGDALLETGKPGNAVPHFEKFLSHEPVEPPYDLIARVRLGLCYYLTNEQQKASSLWSEIDPSDPLVRSELASAYQTAGLLDKKPLDLIEESIAAKHSGNAIPLRLVKNALSVYARNGSLEKGLDLLHRTDLKASSYREALGKSKTIHFYDPSLLGDIAALYGQAGVQFLEKAARDPKTKNAADYLLIQAFALFGPTEQLSKTAAAIAASSSMPQQYKDRTRVWQIAAQYRKDHNAGTAQASWEELFRKRTDDPELPAEALDACGRTRIECANLVQKASASVESGEGKKFMVLNIALGKYHLSRMDSAKAIAYLEAGRDKSNKNKIESNDPLLLVSLAEAYLRTKKFSEVLEIYFEMSKQFPGVRQIQEAVQGVYAMEQKSAGDVKIN